MRIEKLDTNKILKAFENAVSEENEIEKYESIITKLQKFADENGFIIIEYKQNVHDAKVNGHNTVTFTLAREKY